MKNNNKTWLDGVSSLALKLAREIEVDGMPNPTTVFYMKLRLSEYEEIAKEADASAKLLA